MEVTFNESGQLLGFDGEPVSGLYVDAKATKRHYLNGFLHRDDGPAIEYKSGSKAWYLNGETHRTDGPAIEWIDGTKAWYLNDKRLSEEEFLAQTT